jgi:hypothetical protein
MRLLALTIVTSLLSATGDITINKRSTVVPIDRFILDMRRKDIEDILSLYAPSAVFVRSDGTKISGLEDLRTLYQQVFATYDFDNLSFIKLHTLITGSYGSETVEQMGFYSEDLRTRSTDKLQHLCGGYHVHYQHHIDWHFEHPAFDPGADIFNQTSPRPAPQLDAYWLITRQEWTSTPCPASTVK